MMGEMPAKPELHGLPNGWTAGMMGMMTLVRVLSPEMFGHIDACTRAARGGRDDLHAAVRLASCAT